MKVRSSQGGRLAALGAVLSFGCHGASAPPQQSAPRIHLAPPAVTKTAAPPAADESPDRARPPCPAGENALDAAAKAYDSQQYDVALTCAENALLDDPENAAAEQQRGLALAGLGKVDEARLAMIHALALDPDDPETLADAADLYLTRGNVSRELDEIALEYARRGERRARRHHPELLEQLDLLQGMALNDLGRFEEALVKLDQTLERDPKDLDARYEHGVAQFELCRFAGAQSDLKQVLGELPEDAFSHHELGLTLERLGDSRQAQAELARASALDPDSFPAQLPVSMEEFRGMLDAAVRGLPPALHRDLANVKLSAEEIPDLEDLTVDEPPLSPTILGLFRGQPLDDPPAGHAESRAILLYRRNLVRVARDRDELAKQIQITLWHELGHLHGADDDELRLRGLE